MGTLGLFTPDWSDSPFIFKCPRGYLHSSHVRGVFSTHFQLKVGVRLTLHEYEVAQVATGRLSVPSGCYRQVATGRLSVPSDSPGICKCPDSLFVWRGLQSSFICQRPDSPPICKYQILLSFASVQILLSFAGIQILVPSVSSRFSFHLPMARFSIHLTASRFSFHL